MTIPSQCDSEIPPFVWGRMAISLLVVCIVIVNPASGQHIQAVHGLPHPVVHDAARTGDGLMWIGTRQGLAVWDGVSMMTFDPTNSALVDPLIRYVENLPDASVLVGTRLAGLFIAGPGMTKPARLSGGGLGCPNATSAPSDIYSISPLSTNRFLIGTRRGEPWIYSVTHGLCPLRVTGPDTVVSRLERITSAALVSDSIMAVGTWDKGLFLAEYDPAGRILRVDSTSFVSIPGNRIRDLVPDPERDGSLLVATSGSGLVRVRLSDHFLSFAAGMSDHKAWSISLNNDGSMWVGTFDGGVNLVDSTLQTRLILRHDPNNPGSLPHDVATIVFQDDFGTTWAGTDDGVTRVKRPNMRSGTLPGDILSATLDDDNEHIWVGYGTKIVRVRLLDGQTTAVIHMDQIDVARTGFNPIALSRTSRENHLLVGTARQGLYAFSPRGTITPVGGISDGVGILSLLHDSTHSVTYVGLSNGSLAEFRWNGIEPELRMLPFTPEGTSVRLLFIDPEGVLYSKHGLRGMFIDGIVDSVHVSPVGTRINDVMVDTTGTVWVATSRGLIGDGRTFTAMDGLHDDEIYSVTSSTHGRAWVSSASGVSQINLTDGTVKREVYSHIENPTTFINQKLISMPDGSVIALAMNAWFQIWSTNTVSKKPNPLMVSVADSVVTTREIIAPRGQTQIIIEAELRELVDIDGALMAATISSRPESPRLERGNTIQASWRGLDPADSPHIVTIRAVSPDGTVQVRTVYVVLSPFLWNTAWFWLTFAALLTTGLWAATRVVQQRREREMREVQDALTRGREMERRRLARTLHDDSLQTVYGIRQRLELMQYAQKSGDDIEHMLTSTLELTLSSTEALRNVVADLRPVVLEGDDLEFALRSAARSLLVVQSDLDVQWSMAGINAVPKSHQLSVYRIAQSAFSNIVRHANASSVTVRIHDTTYGYIFSIVDNGLGFNDAESALTMARHGHYGLLGMNEWAASVGAMFSIQSQPGEGTHVRVTWSQKASRWRQYYFQV